MKPTIRILLVTLLIAAFGSLAVLNTGCASYKLPPISADEINYSRKDPAGGTTITAKGVRVEGETLKADEATWVTTYPMVSVNVSVKNFRQKAPKKAASQPQP
jgi:hypothetical protein